MRAEAKVMAAIVLYMSVRHHNLPEPTTERVKSWRQVLGITPDACTFSKCRLLLLVVARDWQERR